MMPLPTHCANPICRGPEIKPIHCSSQSIAIDAVDGPPVFAQLVTYRCAQCGHTWAIQGYSCGAASWPTKERSSEGIGSRYSSRA